MNTEQHNASSVTPCTGNEAPKASAVSPSVVMYWDGGERAITAREKAVIEEHRASCFSIPLVAVPAGWVLVPERMTLDPGAVDYLATELGGIDPESSDVDERWCAGLLWVGETEDDDGKKYHGLNIANLECPEEGSIPLVEFPALRLEVQP